MRWSRLGPQIFENDVPDTAAAKESFSAGKNPQLMSLDVNLAEPDHRVWWENIVQSRNCDLHRSIHASPFDYESRHPAIEIPGRANIQHGLSAAIAQRQHMKSCLSL